MELEDGFEWDQTKAEINFKRHKVRFEEAKPLFDDPYSVTVPDNESDPTEQRFATIGMGVLGRLLVVVYTHRSGNIRIISARLAQRTEQEQYTSQMQRSADDENIRLFKRKTRTRPSSKPRTRRKDKDHHPDR